MYQNLDDIAKIYIQRKTYCLNHEQMEVHIKHLIQEVIERTAKLRREKKNR